MGRYRLTAMRVSTIWGVGGKGSESDVGPAAGAAIDGIHTIAVTTVAGKGIIGFLVDLPRCCVIIMLRNLRINLAWNNCLQGKRI